MRRYVRDFRDFIINGSASRPFTLTGSDDRVHELITNKPQEILNGGWRLGRGPCNLSDSSLGSGFGERGGPDSSHCYLVCCLSGLQH